MDTTNHYQIKAVDFCTSNYGYLLKVTMVNGMTADHFKLAYVPFSLFPSVLMTDFLMARKPELSGELLDQLKDAIKKDLESEPSFVIIGDRPGMDQAKLIDDRFDAYRPIERDTTVNRELTLADRPRGKHDLRVFSEIFLGKHPHTRAGNKFDQQPVAYRVIENQLHVEVGYHTGVRDITADATLNSEALQALREYTFKLLVEKQQPVAERSIINDAAIVSSLSQGLRGIVNRLTVMAEQQESEREIDHNGTLQRMGSAQRESTSPLVLHKNITGKRSIDLHPVSLLKEIQARRDWSKIVYVEKRYSFGRLLYRSYPAVLHREIRGLRDNRSDLWLGRTMTATRDVTLNPTLIMREIKPGLRLEVRATPGIYNAMVHRVMPLGYRPNTHQLYTERSYQLGLRRIDAAAHINQDYATGSKPISHVLHLPKEIKGFRKSVVGIYVPTQVFDGKRPDRELHIPGEQTQGRRPEQQLYIESVQYRAQRPYQKDAYLPHDPLSSGGGKLPHPAEMGEDVLGDKTIFPQYGAIDDEIIAHVERTREATLDELMSVGELVKKVLYGLNMEEMSFGTFLKPLYPGDFLEDIIGSLGMYADIMDDVLVGDRKFDGQGWIDLAQEYGISLPDSALIIEEDFVLGIKQRFDALIESDIPWAVHGNDRPAVIDDSPVVADGDILRPAEITIENPLGYFEAQPATIPDGLEGLQEPKPSIIETGAEAKQEPKPSVIEAGMDAGQEPKPSVVEVGLEASQEAKPSVIGEEILAQEPERYAHVGEELLAQEPERQGIIENGTEGQKTEGGSVMDDELLAEIPRRGGSMGEDSTIGERPNPFGTYGEEALQGLADIRQGDHLDSGMLGDFEKRMAMLSTGYILGEKPVDRAGYISDLYFLAVTTGIRDGFIDQEDWQNYASLALRQAIVGEQMFGTDPGKASELLEHIIGYTEPFESHINADMIAQKQEFYADVISQIVGDKELGWAIIEDYLVAQERLKEGILQEPVIGTEELKKALLEQSMDAQSFIYDYNNDDILYEGDDPEHWEEGYGVPEVYDPKDPFNPYYPWTEDLNDHMLDADEWIRFGLGNWDRDRAKYEFYGQSDVSADGGYYRNDFSRTDYVFTIDFKVDEVGDGGAGIVFRYTNEKNYIKFTVYGSGNTPMTLHKVVNGAEASMGSAMNPFSWVQGQWYRLEVSVLERRIKIKVNGRLQYDLVD